MHGQPEQVKVSQIPCSSRSWLTSGSVTTAPRRGRHGKPSSSITWIGWAARACSEESPASSRSKARVIMSFKVVSICAAAIFALRRRASGNSTVVFILPYKHMNGRKPSPGYGLWPRGRQYVPSHGDVRRHEPTGFQRRGPQRGSLCALCVPSAPSALLPLASSVNRVARLLTSAPTGFMVTKHSVSTERGLLTDSNRLPIERTRRNPEMFAPIRRRSRVEPEIGATAGARVGTLSTSPLSEL